MSTDWMSSDWLLILAVILGFAGDYLFAPHENKVEAGVRAITCSVAFLSSWCLMHYFSPILIGWFGDWVVVGILCNVVVFVLVFVGLASLGWRLSQRVLNKSR